MEETVLHVDMDAFYASVERNRKDLEGPIVVCVYSGRSEDSGAVSTCSYDARELGIHAAMPIKRAKKLAEKSGKDVHFVAMDREHYREVSDEIREKVFENYAEKVEQASIDEAYLLLEEDIEEAEEIAENIQAEVLENFGLTCSIGVAPNKLVAKIASDREKPSGLTVVRSEDVEDFMNGLELGDIHGIGGKTIEKLEDLGIDSVESLAQADEQVLIREFGENLGLKLKKKSRGVDDSEIEVQDQKQITRITTLKENSSRASYIEKYFPELADDLMEKIGEKKVGFRKVSLIVIDTEIEMYTRTTTLKSHIQDRETIIEKGKELLEEFLEYFDGEVRRIGLRVLDLKEFADQSNLEEF
jgi:DNA polymerase IV (DinB-like DNA polymerase)